MNKIAVLGAGSWGTAQSILLSQNSAQVYLWGRPEDGLEKIKKTRENHRYMSGVLLPDNVIVSDNMEESLQETDMVVLAVPAQTIRLVAEFMQPYLPSHTILVNTAKGLEISSGMRMSQVLEDVLGEQIKERYAVLSGPSFAEEVARKVPTAVTVAAHRKLIACEVQDAFMTNYFRVYTNPDVAGVEIGGALKNVIALATGIVEGLGYGQNSKAALITRGLTEITRMGVAMGAYPQTFSGLSGMGDLVLTCGSNLSRNLRAGIMIGQGQNLKHTLNEIGMVVEGVHTAKITRQLSMKMQVDMPITSSCFRILYEGVLPREEVEQLMQRRKKHEIEETAAQIEDW
ncbi:MAG: NAD(P)H-dependent glycerol-3-phosphate dehydrogenase [Syntrophomonadaceae bacterium]|nr:NAD(P)H-dependent glycerol-3-phosphate dehydrogenase [Syntrophomonadaceae bacterium]